MTRMMSSREFNQHTGDAKKASLNGPVIVTDRGKPTHVLVSWEEWNRRQGQEQKATDFLAAPDSLEIELPLERDKSLPRDIDLL